MFCLCVTIDGLKKKKIENRRERQEAVAVFFENLKYLWPLIYVGQKSVEKR